jgi:hypothetical protein
MNKQQAILILEMHNNWNKGENGSQEISPERVEKAIDFAVKFMKHHYKQDESKNNSYVKKHEK